MSKNQHSALQTQGEKLSLPLENAKKNGLLTKSKDFLQTAVGSITGKELPKLVEEFTREMVIVAEGLSEDQAILRNTQTLQGEEQDQLSQRLREMEKQLKNISYQVDALTRKAEKRQKRESGLYRILRQATWLVAVAFGSWVLVTLIKTFLR
jgi:septal ring factor EnvC (AmiA/AmiB activator)